MDVRSTSVFYGRPQPTSVLLDHHHCGHATRAVVEVDEGSCQICFRGVLPVRRGDRRVLVRVDCRADRHHKSSISRLLGFRAWPFARLGTCSWIAPSQLDSHPVPASSTLSHKGHKPMGQLSIFGEIMDCGCCLGYSIGITNLNIIL